MYNFDRTFIVIFLVLIFSQVGEFNLFQIILWLILFFIWMGLGYLVYEEDD